MYNILIGRMRISQNLDLFFFLFFFFLLALSDLFLLPFSFPFSLPFYSRYLLLLISFLSPVKSWVFIMGKPWKWVLDPL